MKRVDQKKTTFGAPTADRTATWPSFARRTGKDYVLITGGAGFIGTNLADRVLNDGHRVLIYDNLSRRGSEANLSWLIAKHDSRVRFEQGDVRDGSALEKAVRHAFGVFHFAAQVAVTDSLVNPREDFDINAEGTLELLEAIRQTWNPPILLFTSTNKVYGALPDIELRKDGRHYSPRKREFLKNGVNECRPLDFCSPYGCSKGAADQYVLDYARTFHLPALVFRMSCIYGPHQNGTEDQGWVAHFLIRASQHAAIRIFGDGMQVRDLLFVEDLVDAFLRATSRIEHTAGNAFNIGGGPQNAISLLELLDVIQQVRGERCRIDLTDWRHGDQRYYVSDTRKFASLTGWSPRVAVREGVEILHNWLTNRSDTEIVLPSGSLHDRSTIRDVVTTGS